MAVGTPYALPSAPRAITADADNLWVACGRRGNRKSSIFRVDPKSGDTSPWAETDWTIYDLAIAEDDLIAVTGLTLAGPAAGMAGGGAFGPGEGSHHGGHHGGGGDGGGGGN